MKRWHLMHVGRDLWNQEPESHTIPLAIHPGPDMMSFVVPGLLVLRAVGGISSEQEVYAIDVLTGAVLWKFSSFGHELLFFSCHVEANKRIVATNREGVFLLEREGPRMIFEGKLAPTAVARLSPDGSKGYVLDHEFRLVMFDVETGEAAWSRRSPKSYRFQNPFPLADAVCVSVGSDVRQIRDDGETTWRWSSDVLSGASHAVERLVMPDILLVRTSGEGRSTHETVWASTGQQIADVGDVWAYGADGVTEFPVVLQEGSGELLSFLQEDGTRTASQKFHRMFGGFCSLPDGLTALFYDSFLRFVAGVDANGKIRWRLPYPGKSLSLTTTCVSPTTVYFASSTGELHVWDVGGEEE